MSNLMQRGEAIHVGRVDVGAPLDESQNLVLVAGRARRQEDAAVRELKRCHRFSDTKLRGVRDVLERHFCFKDLFPLLQVK